MSDEPPEPEPPASPGVVDDMLRALVSGPVEEFAQVRDAAIQAGREHEWNAAFGLAVHDLNDRLLRASYDVDDSRRRDLAARIAELQRLTGSEGLGG